MEFNKILTDTIRVQNDIIAAKDAKIKVLSEQVDDLTEKIIGMKMDESVRGVSKDETNFFTIISFIWAIIVTFVLFMKG